MRRAVALLLCLWTLSGAAAAQPAPAAEDIDTLMRDLEQEETTLATANCDTACRALDAIRRISARICELDPGPPCERSRKKLEDATRRVDNTCGPCAPEQKAKKLETEEPTTTAGADEPAPPPVPAADKGGGCASCTIGSRRGGPGVLFLLLMLLPPLRAASRRARHVGASPVTEIYRSPSVRARLGRGVRMPRR